MLVLSVTTLKIDSSSISALPIKRLSIQIAADVYFHVGQGQRCVEHWYTCIANAGNAEL